MSKKGKEKIIFIHSHDVLLGRGGGALNHEGNVNFRKWVGQRKERYQETQDIGIKSNIAREILSQVKASEPPGRFLIKADGTRYGKSYWLEVDDKKALSKTKQALREEVTSRDVEQKRKAPESVVNSSTLWPQRNISVSSKQRVVPFRLHMEKLVETAAIGNAQDLQVEEDKRPDEDYYILHMEKLVETAAIGNPQGLHVEEDKSPDEEYYTSYI